MADAKDETTAGISLETEDPGEVDNDAADDEMEQQNDNSLLEENDDQTDNDQTVVAEESALLDNEPMDDELDHQNDSSLLDESGALEDANKSQNNEQKNGEPSAEASERTDAADDADENAAAEDNIVVLEDEDEGEDDEAEEEEAKKRDINEIPQVNVATLAKRKWQVKVYPLKPEDFVSGQISRVFNSARESLLYILSSGRYSGGKGEMYVSSGMQAAKVVQNLMKLDFKSPNINIEIIKKNAEGVVEEKAFMRFDAKLVRILCVPLLPTRRMGSKRERIIGSVFVKNLPKGASKDMLRVMFPFAPEINYNPEKFHDGTARLVLSTRNAVAPCLKAFAKVELGDTALELRPLQKRSGDEKRTSSSKSRDTESSKKEESKDASSKSESEGKPSDIKKEEKGSPKSSSVKRDSSTRDQSKPSAKKSSSGKTTDVKKEKGAVRNRDSKTDGHKPAGTDSRVRKTQRDQGGSSNNRNWKNTRDHRGDAGLRSNALRNRFRGGTLAQRMDRNRFRSNFGFANRNRTDDRRIRPLQGPSVADDVGINTGTAKEMILLQSQLSMAIKNQLSMLNQTHLALEHAKRGAVGIGMARDTVQQSPPSLLSKRVADEYSMNQLPTEHARRGQGKSTQRRQPQVKRGRPREKRAEGEHFGSLAGDYGYKRNAAMAGLQMDYGNSGFGKRRNAGAAGYSEGPSWSEEPRAFGHPQPPHFGGYEHELADREADFRSLHAGNIHQNSLNYNHSSYGYRY